MSPTSGEKGSPPSSEVEVPMAEGIRADLIASEEDRLERIESSKGEAASQFSDRFEWPERADSMSDPDGESSPIPAKVEASAVLDDGMTIWEFLDATDDMELPPSPPLCPRDYELPRSSFNYPSLAAEQARTGMQIRWDLIPGKAFPFLRLPKNVRLRIYEFTVVCNKALVPYHMAAPKLKYLPPHARPRYGAVEDYGQVVYPNLGLLLANKQIGFEARTALYFANTFTLTSGADAYHFLATIGAENRAWLRGLALDFSGDLNKGTKLKAPLLLTPYHHHKIAGTAFGPKECAEEDAPLYHSDAVRAALLAWRTVVREIAFGLSSATDEYKRLQTVVLQVKGLRCPRRSCADNTPHGLMGLLEPFFQTLVRIGCHTGLVVPRMHTQEERGVWDWFKTVAEEVVQQSRGRKTLCLWGREWVGGGDLVGWQMVAFEEAMKKEDKVGLFRDTDDDGAQARSSAKFVRSAKFGASTVSRGAASRLSPRSPTAGQMAIPQTGFLGRTRADTIDTIAEEDVCTKGQKKSATNVKVNNNDIDNKANEHASGREASDSIASAANIELNRVRQRYHAIIRSIERGSGSGISFSTSACSTASSEQGAAIDLAAAKAEAEQRYRSEWHRFLSPHRSFTAAYAPVKPPTHAMTAAAYHAALASATLIAEQQAERHGQQATSSQCQDESQYGGSLSPYEYHHKNDASDTSDDRPSSSPSLPHCHSHEITVSPRGTGFAHPSQASGPAQAHPCLADLACAGDADLHVDDPAAVENVQPGPVCSADHDHDDENDDENENENETNPDRDPDRDPDRLSVWTNDTGYHVLPRGRNTGSPTSKKSTMMTVVMMVMVMGVGLLLLLSSSSKTEKSKKARTPKPKSTSTSTSRPLATGDW
ncbi:MAG: hypothetical protein M1819_004256 [Sarea resinae]|nr:MAG: hypothetical protein M1819_004256 [Sarea resinae]